MFGNIKAKDATIIVVRPYIDEKDSMVSYITCVAKLPQ